MKTKRNFNESQLGIEYLCDVISSCEQNGVSCIVDDANGDILIYDVKKGLWIDHRRLMNADASVFEMFQDDDLYEQVMFKASGDEFKEFAVKWNDLQKKGESDEVYKTRECKPIMGAFAESKFKPLDALTRSDREELGIYDDPEDYDHDIPTELPKHVPGRCWDCNRKFDKMTDDGSGVDKYNFSYCSKCAPKHDIIKKYSDFTDEQWMNIMESEENEEDYGVGDGQLHIFKQNEQVGGGDYYTFILPDGGCYQVSETAPYGGESFYDGDIGYSTRQEMEDELDAIELDEADVPKDILKLAYRLATTQSNESSDEVSEGRYYGRTWGGERRRDGFGNLRDPDPASMAMWNALCNDEYKNRKPKPEEDKSADDKDSVTESDEGVIEGIPNWATSYIMYDDPSGLEDEDIKDVDDFILDLAGQNIVLTSPIEGTENEFNSHPAFGKACDTTDWGCMTM